MAQPGDAAIRSSYGCWSRSSSRTKSATRTGLGGVWIVTSALLEVQTSGFCGLGRGHEQKPHYGVGDRVVEQGGNTPPGRSCSEAADAGDEPLARRSAHNRTASWRWSPRAEKRRSSKQCPTNPTTRSSGVQPGSLQGPTPLTDRGSRSSAIRSRTPDLPWTGTLHCPQDPPKIRR